MYLGSEVEVPDSRSSDTYQLDGGRELGGGGGCAGFLGKRQMQIHLNKNKPEVVFVR